MNGKIVVASLVVIVIVAIAISVFAHEEREYAYIERVDLKLSKLNDSCADITFFVKIKRSRVLSANLSISVYDYATDILLKRRTISIPKDANELNITISFEKDKNYRVMFEIIKGDKTISSTGLILKNLRTLIPKEKELKLLLRDVDFEVKSVKGDRVTVKARFYIDALKSYTVKFHIKAIQFESNVLTSDKWLTLNLTSGKTTVVESDLEVVKDYNYLIKLEAWKNDYLIKSWSRCLNLAPTKRIPKNVSEEEVKFEVEKFVKPKEMAAIPMPTPVERHYPMTSYGKSMVATPGFEIVIGLIAIGGALAWRSGLKKL